MIDNLKAAINGNATSAKNKASALPWRRVRSFVTRAGRISNAQQRALETLGPRFVLPYAPYACAAAPLDWQASFGRNASCVLEIGFGMGEATAEIAAQAPHVNFVGIEVHEAGIGALLKRIDEYALSNIRIIQRDAVEVVKSMIAPASLDGVHIFFPDPWPKKRHRKRRLIQSPFAALLARRLKPGAYLHCVTDCKDYAEQMLAVLSAQQSLQNTAHGYAPRPAYRPLTKFEARAQRLGHNIMELVFKRRID